jgi:hypothetical protein
MKLNILLYIENLCSVTKVSIFQQGHVHTLCRHRMSAQRGNPLFNASRLARLPQLTKIKEVHYKYSGYKRAGDAKSHFSTSTRAVSWFLDSVANDTTKNWSM